MMNQAATLRGIGREAYRKGLFAHHAIRNAREALGRDLNDADRSHIYAGWRAERADVTAATL